LIPGNGPQDERVRIPRRVEADIHQRYLEDIELPAGAAFSQGWRTDTAVSLARQMYEAREFGAMPILADALQDASCDSEIVLGHCRDASIAHVRGCWVIDLVLGKQ